MITQSLLLQLLLALAVITLVAAIVFILRGLGARGTLRRQAYDVGRQQARQRMQVAFTRALLALLLGFILFGVYGVFARPAPFFPAPTPLPPTPLPTPLPTATDTPADTPAPAPTATDLPVPPTVGSTPTSPIIAATQTATAVPTTVPTNTGFLTATVNSPLVGLYLRNEPGGTEEVELLPDGLVLILLEGTATANELEWQRVQAPSGNTGWVAIDYILYGTTRPPDPAP